jgi:hypothetical protein
MDNLYVHIIYTYICVLIIYEAMGHGKQFAKCQKQRLVLVDWVFQRYFSIHGIQIDISTKFPHLARTKLA